MNNQTAAAWLQSLEKELPHGAYEKLLRAHELIHDSGVNNNVIEPQSLLRAQGIVEILAALNVDVEPLIAAYLAFIPNVQFSKPVLVEEFGEGVAALVEGVERIRIIDNDEIKSSYEQDQAHLEGLRKLLLGMAEDVRVVLIKLAERVQVMRDLKTKPDSVRRRVAQETVDIFAPLANRLGVWQLKWELEDLSFRFLDPDNYQRIAKLLDERRTDREKYISSVIDILSENLKRNGIAGEVIGRPKHIFSIWKKMQGKSIDFHQLFDVRAVRVLVNTVAECYAVLGLVHTLWQPIRSEFDDYIASPKENLYQSLHTAVVGPEGKTLEIQIRTHDMHQHSEHGVAAHWGYKEGGRHSDIYREKIAWLRQILEWKEEERNTEDFLDRFKSEVFQDRVYVLTPRGKVMDLPKGSTPLDFAYHVHTDVGHHYRGAKVNGRIVSINYELKNGEQVEILTSAHGNPSRDWLNPHLGFLHSSRAKAKVRGWFRQQDYDQNLIDGRNTLDKELHRLGVPDVGYESLAKLFHFDKVDDFYASIGCGDITTSQIAGQLVAKVLPKTPAEKTIPQRRLGAKHPQVGAKESDVQILGVGDLVTHIAHCCKPVPGESILGYITRGHGITIHRSDCHNIRRFEQAEPERVIEVAWQQGLAKTYMVDIHVRAFDRQGLLRDITEILSNDHLNVTAVNTLTERKTNIANMRLSLDVADVSQLSGALAKIEHLPNVLEVARAQS
jgi:GTP pyrophosphokinase